MRFPSECVLVGLILTGLLFMFFIDFRLAQQINAAASGSLQSVSTFPVCEEIFGNTTDQGKQNTDGLCGAPGATASRLFPTTLIQVAIPFGNGKAEDGIDSSSETFTFSGFPRADYSQQEIDNFDPENPCEYIKAGQPCEVFAGPLTLSVSASKLVYAYPLKELTDPFPYSYISYDSILEYGTDDENGEVNSHDQNCDVNHGGGQCSDTCQCGLAIGGEGSTFDSSICTRKRMGRDILIGGKSSTNAGHYLDETCVNAQNIGGMGQLAIVNSWAINRKGGYRTGFIDSTPVELPFDIYRGARFEADKDKVDQIYQTMRNALISNQGSNRIRNYNRNTISACMAYLYNANTDSSVPPVNLIGACKNTQNVATNGRFPSFRDPASTSLRGSLVKGGDGSIQNFNTGTCVTCIAEYKDSYNIPGMFGSYAKCQNFVEDWTNAFVIDLRSPVNQDALRNDGDADSFDIYYERTQVAIGSEANPFYQSKCCRFVLPHDSITRVLGRCPPTSSGDTCWESYNRPPQFVQTQNLPSSSAKTDIEDGSFPQGFENSPPSPDGTDVGGALPNFGYKNRGLALTPFFPTNKGSGTTNGDVKTEFFTSHVYRCGSNCNPEGSETGAQSDKEKSPIDKGRAKAWLGLGPFCKAYEVSRTARPFFEVNVNVAYQNGKGEDVSTETIRLSSRSSNYFSGSALGTTRDGGIAAQLNPPRGLSGVGAPPLGGVVVVCGAVTKASSSASIGKISGTLGPGISPTVNPWGVMKTLIENAAGRLGSGYDAFGVKKHGRVAPIPGFVTALQCFNYETACLPDQDVCQALFDACKRINADEDVKIDLCRVAFEYITEDDADFGKCGDSASADSINVVKLLPNGDKELAADNESYICKTCSTKKNVPLSAFGQSWYYLPPEHLKSFGKNCGQYGMPLNYGKDENTAQYVCSSPGSTVRCVPGYDAISSGTKSPCEVIGGLVNYHGQSSGTKATVIDDTRKAMCYPDVSDFDADSFAPQVGIPEGLPTNWNGENPYQWVDMLNGNFLYAEATNANSELADVSVYVNGRALNAAITSISKGIFINATTVPDSLRKSCSLEKNAGVGASTLPVYIQNVGTQTASYVVNFNGCNSDNVRATTQTIPIQNVAPGKLGEGEFEMEIALDEPAVVFQCYLTLSPPDQSSVVFDAVATGCTVVKGLENRNSGVVGVDENKVNELTTGCLSSDEFCLFAEDKKIGITLIVGIVFLALGLLMFVIVQVHAIRVTSRELEQSSRDKFLTKQAIRLDVQKGL